jgi:hypothetical protein
MKTNQLIKKQARLLLKGNWVPLIIGLSAVLLAVLLAVLTALCLETALLYLFDLVNSEGTISDNISSCITVGCATLLMLLSPLLNGVLKMCANLSVNHQTYVSEMFYFFSSPGLYLKTILVNLLVLLSFAVMSALTDIYRIIVIFTNQDFGSEGISPVMVLLLVAALIVSVIIKILLYAILVHYQMFVYSFGDKGFAESTILLLPFAFKHFGKLMRLSLSFAGWFALCFFVLPALYTVPYFAVSSANMVKWLLQTESKSAGGAL